MGTLPWYKQHYRFMPDTENDPLFQERVDELRLDRAWERQIRYHRGSAVSVEYFYLDHTPITEEDLQPIKVDPGFFTAKYRWSRHVPGGGFGDEEEISEDERLLGKKGAAVIADVDMNLYDYNTVMRNLSDMCYNETHLAKRLMSAASLNVPKLMGEYHKVSDLCVRVERTAIENYIIDHPDATAEEINEIINANRSYIHRKVDSFVTAAQKTNQQMIDRFINTPEAEDIMRSYTRVSIGLNESPLSNFIKLSRKYYQARFTKDPSDRISWMFDNKRDKPEKLYEIAWLIETNGFQSITSGVWPLEIRTIRDFVVVAYQLLYRRKDGGTTYSFGQHLGDHANRIEYAYQFPGLISRVEAVYRSCRFPKESGAQEVYDEWTNLIDKTLYTRRDYPVYTSKITPDALVPIKTRGEVAIHKMRTMESEYQISREAAFIKDAAGVMDREVSALDYEELIRDIVNDLMLCTCCRDGDRRILYTVFKVTDETRNDAIALALILKALKKFVSSMQYSVGGVRRGVTKNVHDILYREIRGNKHGKNMMLSGIIYWNTDNPNDFKWPLKDAFEFM